MNTSLNKPASHSPSHATNPFARALAEARGGQGSDDSMGADFNAQDQQKMMSEQQKLQKEQARRQRLRERLHREINPVEAHDVFNAREAQVKKEIEQIRHELIQLNQEMKGLQKEVDLTLATNIAEPGQDGVYFITFFQQLRQFIQLLRLKVHSARTWATTFNSKKGKARKGGMEISGKSYEQTATVFDRMHHERSTVYSGS